MGGLGSVILVISLSASGQAGEAAPVPEPAVAPAPVTVPPAEAAAAPPVTAPPAEAAAPENVPPLDKIEKPADFPVPATVPPGKDEAPAPEPEKNAPAEKTDPVKPAQPPAPPIEYLKAGIVFFNTQKYDKAGPYLEAAHRFRDRLKEKERVVLDVYRDELAKYQRAVKEAAEHPATDSDVERTSRLTVDSALSAKPVRVPSAIARMNPDTAANPPRSALATTRVLTKDRKQEARWLLHEAREQIMIGRYDQAAKKVEEARALDVKWHRLEDTPDKVVKVIDYARAHQPEPRKAKEDLAHDLPTAGAKLGLARISMANQQLDRAEQIAREVQTWGLNFRAEQDSPEMILKAIRSIRMTETLKKYGGPAPAAPAGSNPK